MGDKEELSDFEGGRALEQAAWRSCGVSVLGSFQASFGQALCWDGIVTADPAWSQGAGLDAW